MVSGLVVSFSAGRRWPPRFASRTPGIWALLRAHSSTLSTSEHTSTGSTELEGNTCGINKVPRIRARHLKFCPQTRERCRLSKLP